MAWTLVFFLSCLLGASAQQQCGRDVDGKLCDGGLCCSQFGYCGTTPPYCGEGCQSQCTLVPAPPVTPTPPPPVTPAPPPPDGDDEDLTSLIPQSTFESMLMHRSSPPCPGGFYTYDAFITAAKDFAGFAAVGDTETRKREIAAFFAQTSQETTGGWPDAPDGPYAWGYCWIEELNSPSDYCQPSIEWPCVPGKKYFGRGPIQLSYNYNYGPAGAALGIDLLGNPDLVSADPTLSFKTALWFWMTAQPPKPSCHDVITGLWEPTIVDLDAGRNPGFGVTTNIINGGLECGRGEDARVANRIGFYLRYCDIFGVDPGPNLDCYHQTPFGLVLSFDTK